MINSIAMKPLLTNVMPKEANETSGLDLSQQFGSFLNQAISNISNQESAVDQLNQRFIAGDLPDVHQLMIGSESAMLGLELTLQVRNKMIEAYQEIMRLQM